MVETWFTVQNISKLLDAINIIKLWWQCPLCPVLHGLPEPQSALVGHIVHPCLHDPQGMVLSLPPTRVKQCFSCSCTHFLLQHLLRCRETFCIMGSGRVTKEESYFRIYFGNSHTLQEMEPPHVRWDCLYKKKLGRWGRSFLPAKMDPAKHFSVKTRFLNILWYYKRFNCLCLLPCRQEPNPELCHFLSHSG